MKRLSKVIPMGKSRTPEEEDLSVVRPLHRGTFFAETAERRMKERSKKGMNSASNMLPSDDQDGLQMKKVQKRNLMIQKTTEDLLQGSSLINRGATAVFPSPAQATPVDDRVSERRRSTFVSRKTMRLSQMNLRQYNEKVHVKEKQSKSFGQVAVTNVITSFFGLFIVFSALSMYAGYSVNLAIGPVWERLGKPKEELETRMFLDVVSLPELLENFVFFDPEGARAAVNDLTKINCVVFSIMVQVTTILVQVGAKEFSTNAISLFVRDKALVATLLFYTLTMTYMVVLTLATSETYIPRGEILIGALFTLVCVLALIPYFLYLIRMLNPLKLVRKVADSGLKAVTFDPKRDCPADSPHLLDEIQRKREQATWAVENIAQFSINSMQNQRSTVAFTCIEVLSHFLIGFGSNKDHHHEQFFTVTPGMRETPDFFSLTDENVRDLERRRCWLEYKVLRQYLKIYRESLEIMKDVAYVLAVNTRKIAEASARRHDYHAFEYCIRFFNTFIRLGISNGDSGTVNNLLHQYRLISTSVLSNDEELVNLVSKRKKKAIEEGFEFFQVDDLIQITGNYVVEEARDIVIAMEKKIISIGQYLVYYSNVALLNNVSFVPETIAHELALICQSAFLRNRECHQELLLTFLMLHEASQERQLHSLTWGIRSAQIKLATFYAANNGYEFFHCIQKTFADCSKDDLVRAWRRLERVHDREFWEVNDRGTNIEYLSPEQKRKLPTFFNGLGVTLEDLQAKSYFLSDEDYFETVQEESPIDYESEIDMDWQRDSTSSSEQRKGSTSTKERRNTNLHFQQEPIRRGASDAKEDYVTPDAELLERPPGSTGRQSRRRSRRNSIQIQNLILEGKSPYLGSEAVRAAVESLQQYRNTVVQRKSTTENQGQAENINVESPPQEETNTKCDQLREPVQEQEKEHVRFSVPNAVDESAEFSSVNP